MNLVPNLQENVAQLGFLNFSHQPYHTNPIPNPHSLCTDIQNRSSWEIHIGLMFVIWCNIRHWKALIAYHLSAGYILYNYAFQSDMSLRSMTNEQQPPYGFTSHRMLFILLCFFFIFSRYPDLPCISQTLSVTFEDTHHKALLDGIHIVGDISMTGSLQIVELQEQPGAILVRWDEVLYRPKFVEIPCRPFCFPDTHHINPLGCTPLGMTNGTQKIVGLGKV